MTKREVRAEKGKAYVSLPNSMLHCRDVPIYATLPFHNQGIKNHGLILATLPVFFADI